LFFDKDRCALRPQRARQYLNQFLDASWFVEDVFSVLTKKNVALWLAERNELVTPDKQTADFSYLRLRKEGYSANDRAAISRRMRSLAQRFEIFAYLGGACTSNSSVFVADISNPASTTQHNWTAATMADPVCAEFLGGGMNSIGAGNSGIAFDTVANDFVAWPNKGNSVYILTPDPVNQRLTCQKSTFAGGPPNSSHTGLPNSTNGTFGRFQYFPGPDVFVVVNDWNIPTYGSGYDKKKESLKVYPCRENFDP
jgi:hypothetical protein